MKALIKMSFFALCTVLISAGCSGIQYFYQVGHVKSADGNVVKDEGTMKSESDDVVLAYDFWGEYGKVSFIVTNNSDRDMFVHMDKSFFIRNGMAYDYFNDLRYSSNSVDTYSTMSKGGVAFSYAGYRYMGSSIMNSTSVATSSTKSNSVEYPEKIVVVVPAMSSKVISKFDVTDFMYRSCDLFLYKFGNREDQQSVSFDSATSPLNFENRMVCSFDGSDELIRFNDKFYVDEITNMKDEAFKKSAQPDQCPDESVSSAPNPTTTSTPKTYNYVMRDVDRYYIKYSSASYGYYKKH